MIVKGILVLATSDECWRGRHMRYVAKPGKLIPHRLFSYLKDWMSFLLLRLDFTCCGERVGRFPTIDYPPDLAARLSETARKVDFWNTDRFFELGDIVRTGTKQNTSCFRDFHLMFSVPDFTRS